jgi:ABC-type transporter Mla maintaining outer membrane lipid asymmetry permease subunit MlaE
MSTPDDLYRPPAAEPPPDSDGLSAAEWRYVAPVFVLALVGLSVITGVILCLQAGSALEHFGAARWTAAVVAVGAMRTHGAGAAVSAAGLALVAAAHRRSAAGAAPPRRGLWWPAVIALPLAAPIAAIGMIASAVGLASPVFDVPLGDLWAQVLQLSRPADLLAGAAAAAVLGAALGGAAPFAGRLLTFVPGRWIGKVAVALVVGHTLTAALNAAWNALSPADEEGPIPGLVPR